MTEGVSPRNRSESRCGMAVDCGVSRARSPAVIHAAPIVVRSIPAARSDATCRSYGGVRRSASLNETIGPQAATAASTNKTRSAATARSCFLDRALLVELNRREQLLEIFLLRRDRFGRPGQLEEDAAAWSFDDCTYQAIARHRLSAAHHGPAHSGVGAGRINDGNRHAAHCALVDFCRRRFAVGAQHLSLPAFNVRGNVAALSRSEVIHHAFGGP